MPAGYGIDRTTEGLLPWGYVSERMAGAHNYWVGTTRPDGRPHIAPVWGLWLDEAFYFSSDPTSRKGRNLAASPEVVVHLESGDEVVILEGTVELVKDEATLTRFADAYDAKYQVRPDTSDPAFGFYRLRPRVAFAWRERDFPQSATRWLLTQN
jgi:PPOX class probable F420-dependent enzyme